MKDRIGEKTAAAGRAPYEAPVLTRLDVNKNTESAGGWANWLFPHLMGAS